MMVRQGTLAVPGVPQFGHFLLSFGLCSFQGHVQLLLLIFWLLLLLRLQLLQANICLLQANICPLLRLDVQQSFPVRHTATIRRYRPLVDACVPAAAGQNT